MFRFPRTNFHELNLDWILDKIKDLDKKVKQLIETGGGGAAPYDGIPANLGTAAPGTSNQFARGDHVHQMPNIPAPMNPYNNNPAALGTASPGVSVNYARGDHVHPMPEYGDFIIPVITDNSSGSVSKILESDKIYHFTSTGITNLNLTLNNTGNKHFHFDFISGATAAVISIIGVSWVNGFFTPAANTKYEVDILDGMGVYAAWPI